MQDTNRARSERSLPSRCATCGAPLEADEWYPTESVMCDDDVVEILVFCDESCLSAWNAK